MKQHRTAPSGDDRALVAQVDVGAVAAAAADLYDDAEARHGCGAALDERAELRRELRRLFLCLWRVAGTHLLEQLELEMRTGLRRRHGAIQPHEPGVPGGTHVQGDLGGHLL